MIDRLGEGNTARNADNQSQRLGLPMGMAGSVTRCSKRFDTLPPRIYSIGPLLEG